MTPLLQQLVARVEQLPQAAQDDTVKRLLAELDDEARWDRSFADSPDLLARLAEEALAEDKTSKMLPRDPDTL